MRTKLTENESNAATMMYRRMVQAEDPYALERTIGFFLKNAVEVERAGSTGGAPPSAQEQNADTEAVWFERGHAAGRASVRREIEYPFNPLPPALVSLRERVFGILNHRVCPKCQSTDLPERLKADFMRLPELAATGGAPTDEPLTGFEKGALDSPRIAEARLWLAAAEKRDGHWHPEHTTIKCALDRAASRVPSESPAEPSNVLCVRCGYRQQDHHADGPKPDHAWQPFHERPLSSESPDTEQKP